jgi:hypothetical protein
MTMASDDRSAGILMSAKLWLQNHVLLISLSLYVSVAQVRLIKAVLNLNQSADVAHNVFVGRPPWRLFQSRVLGPYLVEGLSRITVSPLAAAYSLYACLMLAAAGCLAYSLGHRLAGKPGGALSFTFLYLGFALLLTSPWLYAWDFVNIIVFLIFVYLVVARKPYRWFVVLFLVAIFNHESALFIGLWLVVDPLARWSVSKVWRVEIPIEWRQIAVGGFCLVAGMILIEILRWALLIEELPMPEWYRNHLFHFQGINNLHFWAYSFTHFSDAPFAIPLFLIGAAISTVVVALRWPMQLLGLSIVQMLMIVAVLLFGNAPETRIYLELLPFLALVIVLLAAPTSSLDERPLFG